MVTATLALLLLVVLASVLGTGLMRRYALRRRVLDIPNVRSSHARAVPLGGGVPLAGAAIVGTGAAYFLGMVQGRLALAIAAGGTVLSIVGWIDDRRSLPVALRGAVQGAIVLAAVLLMGGLPRLALGGAVLPLGWFGVPLAVIGIMWVANLYNFMDGIDGMAGGQAVAAGLLGGGIVWWLGRPDLATAPLVLGASALGFLVWNWQPARIFMGDSGSVMLGYSFGVTAVASENGGALPLLGWALIFGGFLFDATATVLRRMARREQWTAAHRLHAYQRLVQSGLSHAQVSGAFVLLAAAMAGAVMLMSAAPLRSAIVVAAAFALLAALYYVVERRTPMGAGPRRKLDETAASGRPQQPDGVAVDVYRSRAGR